MHISCQITINKKLSDVLFFVALTERYCEWTPYLKHVEALKGPLGEQGSKSRLIFDIDGKETVYTETVLKKKLPEFYICQFESPKTLAVVRNCFDEEEGKTLWHVRTDIKFKQNFSLYSFFAKRKAKRLVLKEMKAFKSYVENTKAAC